LAARQVAFQAVSLPGADGACVLVERRSTSAAIPGREREELGPGLRVVEHVVLSSSPEKLRLLPLAPEAPRVLPGGSPLA
jgi:hypothetical protein